MWYQSIFLDKSINYRILNFNLGVSTFFAFCETPNYEVATLFFIKLVYYAHGYVICQYTRYGNLFL